MRNNTTLAALRARLDILESITNRKFGLSSEAGLVFVADTTDGYQNASPRLSKPALAEWINAAIYGADVATRKPAEEAGEDSPTGRKPKLDGGLEADRKRALVDVARGVARIMSPEELDRFATACQNRARKLETGDLEPLDAYEEAPKIFAAAAARAKALDL